MALNGISLRHAVFVQHRNSVFISLALFTSILALRPDSTIIPVIVNLCVLYIYTPFVFRADEARQRFKVGTLGLVISIGAVVCRRQASLQALSSKMQSILVLFVLSSILSSISLGALWASNKLSTRLSSSWSQLLFFPALWATVWWIISYLSPVGYLSTWNVGDDTDAYSWLTQYLGPTGKNWIIGAWTVVLSQTVTAWYMDDVDHETDHSDCENSRNRKLLGAFLCFLAIPSCFLNPLPLPIYEVDKATPITVGCVIPPLHRYQDRYKHRPSLDDYIYESNRLRSMGAKIILWPEGAVVFNDPHEKEHAFSAIRKKVTGPYVGVSFEETISDPSDPTGRAALSRTGIAVLSQHLDETHLLYYKRNLVPFAESYRLRGSSTPPGLFYAQMPNPGNGINNTEWALNGTRPILVTTSICLDFATRSPFSDLDSRPGLILAPARTWDRTVGYAMWLQAKQRAKELNSMVLWCDGGDGGVSGIAGGNFNDISQVGSGSFVETIGVQYPFDMHRTSYARFGGAVVSLLWLPIFGLYSGWMKKSILGGYRLLQEQTASTPAQQRLIDV